MLEWPGWPTRMSCSTCQPAATTTAESFSLRLAVVPWAVTVNTLPMRTGRAVGGFGVMGAVEGCKKCFVNMGGWMCV